MKSLRNLRVVALLLLIIISISACKKKEATQNTASVSPSAGADLTTTQTPVATITPPETTSTPQAQATVTQTVAYYFSDIEGMPNLYTAFEVYNDGKTDIYIDTVHIVFHVENYSSEADFSPMLNKDDIIHPGQKAVYAYWSPYERDQKLTAASQVTAEVSVTPANADQDRQNKILQVEDMQLIQNYPTFATLSGTVNNRDCKRAFSLELIYTGFYDENEQLLGAWHFINNMSIPLDETRHFVAHMNTLPISELDEKAATIRARGIGIE